MDTLKYIIKRYNLDITQPSPIEIPNVGRDVLGEWFNDLGYKEGAEIGVERGLNSEMMLQRNPTMRLHCIDPWRAYRGYKEPTVTRNLTMTHCAGLRNMMLSTTRLSASTPPGLFSPIVWTSFTLTATMTFPGLWMTLSCGMSE
jgi:hypothetical protein